MQCWKAGPAPFVHGKLSRKTSGSVIVSQGIQGMKESWSECPCNVNCLSPAAKSSWLCLPLRGGQKRRNCPPSLTKYQFNFLRFCHLVLWAWWISSGNLPFVCPLTGHRQHFLLTCCSYSGLDGDSNRNDTWVSTFSLLFGEQKGNENSLTCWRGDGWGGLKHLSRQKQSLTAWGSSPSTLHPFSPLGKVWSPPGTALQEQPVTVSWNITEALQHMELCYDNL